MTFPDRAYGAKYREYLRIGDYLIVIVSICRGFLVIREHIISALYLHCLHMMSYGDPNKQNLPTSLHIIV